MFSITPRTGRLTLAAIAADSAATFWAAGCGVVTTNTSPRGRYWRRDSAMSPVPGGMSIEQEVGLVPEHVGEELLERLVQHRAAPDDRLALRHEVADRDAAHAPRFGRDDHLVDHRRVAVGAEHARDRVAVDVGVDDADRVALLGEGDGEVGRDARLADAALARRDQQRPGLRAGLGERDRAALGVAVGRAPGRRSPPASPCRLLRSSSRSWSVITVNSRSTRVDAVERGRRVGHPVLDLVAQRAAGDGEGDEHADDAVAADVDAADHAEVDDRAVQLGVLDRSQRLDDLLGEVAAIRCHCGDGVGTCTELALRR